MGPTKGARRGWIVGFPVALMMVSIVVLVTCCVGFLRQASEGEVGFASMWPLVLGTVGFLVGSMGAVVLQGRELVSRVVGPSERIGRILHRVREGDLTQRVHLRNGDLLADLADDVNQLIEWLNQNPPVGAVTGGDVVEVGLTDDLVEDDPVDDDQQEVAVAADANTQRAAVLGSGS